MFPCQRSTVSRYARKDSPTGATANFPGYADYMQTEAFAEGLIAPIDMSRRRRTAIMCVEAASWRCCHRSLVADALSVRAFRRSRFYRRAATTCIS